MSPEHVDRFRRRLLEMRDRLKGEISHLIETVRTDAQPIGEHDHGVSEAVDKEIVLNHAEDAIRREVIAALIRIEENRYGKCEDCGKPIAIARLEAMPYAAACVNCERKRELG